MKNIILFGSTGMLGNYINKILSKNNNVINITRKEYNINEPDINKLELIIKNNINNQTIIINCAGAIPQRNDSNNIDIFIYCNSLFPNHLTKIGEKYNLKIIHITTDCVFSGKKGLYDEDDYPDETNIYGVSKYLGENKNLCIIRTSIIGEEIQNKKSLLEWVKFNKGNTINGFVNHFWNGVTCLELSNVIERIINENLYWSGVRHIFSIDIVSKYDILNYINEIYKLEIVIIPKDTEMCNKSLKTKFREIFVNKTVKEQLIELEKFNL